MLTFEVPDKKRIRAIIDSDTACEADDPFAIAYALMSPKLMVKAIVAEHFAKPDSMEKSWQAARRLATVMKSDVPVLRGQRGPQADDPISEGVQAIIDEARKADVHPLYVLCLGALTNVARAFREAPDIAERLTVITIGGQAYDEPAMPWREFNFGNDVGAANAVLQSGARIWQIPMNVYGTIRVGLAELQARVAPCGEVGWYLYEQMVAFNSSPEGDWAQGESWSLGDSPAVAAALHPQCGRLSQVNVRVVKDDTAYAEEVDGKTFLVYRDIDSRYLMEDFYAKLALH